MMMMMIIFFFLLIVPFQNANQTNSHVVMVHAYPSHTDVTLSTIAVMVAMNTIVVSITIKIYFNR